ncbi:MAG: hypothetical protein Q3Y08_05960 [Butyricicoccus sp.]|nr:hypothetical protein [Butyricicoccus sp.]
MKRARVTAAMLLLTFCFLLLPLHASASTIVLTAVNDTFLPLSTSTMPTKKSGEWYAPYAVFNSFQIASSVQEEGDVLVLQGESKTLTFSVSQGYVYDQNMNGFSQPAYSINGTIYVPVKLVCSQFGLSYSLISGENQILRICDENAMLSDNAFVSQSSGQAGDIVDEYKEESVPRPQPQPEPEEPEVDNSPEPVPPEEPIEPAAIRPNLIYLTFYGTPNEYSADLLDTLQLYGRTATFFLPATEGWDAEFIRRILAQGHTLGLWVNAADIGQLQNANDRLFALTGTVTRLISIREGSDRLTEEQRSTLLDAGYRLWDATVTADDETQNASQVASWMLRSFDGTTATTVLAMHHTKSTNAALTLILRDLRVNDVHTQAATVADAPINRLG